MNPFPTPEELAAKEFFIFPCNAKKEPKVRWPVMSTYDLPAIQQWAHQFPEGYWGVDCGKSGLLVLDDDRGKKKIAEVSLGYLEFENEDLPETFTVRTPSGGYHYYFRCENGGTTTDTIGKGLDTRGQGGYVVAPGSPGYEVVKDLPIADAPLWLINLSLESKKSRKTITLANDVEYDTPGNIERAIKYLQSAAPAIEGSCGDDHTVKVAMRCKDMAISPDKLFDLMWDHFNPRCIPEWKPDELVTKIENAFLYGGSPVGCDSPEAIFTEVDVDAPDPNRRPLFIDARELIRLKLEINYLVDGLIEQPTLGLMFGEPSSGKSFLAVDLALSVAFGIPWMGAPTKKGRALYFNGEGYAGMGRRIQAWLKHHSLDDIPPGALTLTRRQTELTEKSVRGLESDIAADVQQYGPLSLIIVDTLSRHLEAGKNENQASDMSGFLKALDDL